MRMPAQGGDSQDLIRKGACRALVQAPMQGDWHRGASRVRLRDVTIAVLVVFCLGVTNFAAQKAILESGHPMGRPEGEQRDQRDDHCG